MVIGITGGFCTGKSTVAKIFRNLGAKIIDLDQLAHLTLSPGTETFRKIIKEFGSDILVNNQIDRSILAKKVFGNKQRLDKLNSIIHPIVIKQMLSLIKQFSKSYKVIAVEAPLLFEASLKKYFDHIIMVKSDENNQVERAIKKTGLSRKDILERINSQWAQEKKTAQADFVIDNNQSIKEVRRQAKEVWSKLS